MRPIFSTSFASRVAPEADVVREHHRADDVAVPVHRVDAVEQWNLQARLQRVRLVLLVHRAPVLDRVGLRIRVAAAQHRAEAVLLDLGGVLDEELIGLRHLRDLLLERHPREEGLGLRVEREELGLRRHGRGPGRGNDADDERQCQAGQGSNSNGHGGLRKREMSPVILRGNRLPEWISGFRKRGGPQARARWRSRELMPTPP